MKPLKLLCSIFLLLFVSFLACKDKDKGKEEGTKKMEDVTSKNMDVAKSFKSMIEKNDWAGIEKIMAPGFSDHSPMNPPGSPFNRDTLMKYLKMNKEAFPDMKFEVQSMAGNNDLVFVQYRFTGTNTGPMMGMPATNKKVDYSGVDLIKIKDGIATEHWDYGDNLSFMKQMGMLPEQ